LILKWLEGGNYDSGSQTGLPRSGAEVLVRAVIVRISWHVDTDVAEVRENGVD
jgi:hypothetical protein